MYLWPMLGLTVLTATAGALVAIGTLEQRRHLRALARIPTRIHVNGTRGKSSVTRLIAAGLRAGGRRTVAKTTGTLPRVILPDGREWPIERPGRANVIEQVKMVKRAAEIGAEVLVVECMALQPHLQWLSESRFIRATHGVITNARADHLDVMGPTEVDVAKALAGMVPTRPGAALFTTERDHLQVFEAACADRGSRLVPVRIDVLAALLPDLDHPLAGFPYLAHPENVALALRLCSDLGVAPHVALKGMKSSTPDPGATTTHRVEIDGRVVMFYNGFAANDPESTQSLWQMAIDQAPPNARRVALVNSRADREDRSRQLAEAIARWTTPHQVALMGSGSELFARLATRAGMDPARLVHLEHLTPAALAEQLTASRAGYTVVVGMGNIGDQGLDVVNAFRCRETGAI